MGSYFRSFYLFFEVFACTMFNICLREFSIFLCVCFELLSLRDSFFVGSEQSAALLRTAMREGVVVNNDLLDKFV